MLRDMKEELDALIGDVCGLANRLASAELRPLTDSQLLSVRKELARAQSMLDAAANEVTDRVEACSAYTDDGAVTLRSWLAHRCQMSGAHSRRAATRVRVLRELPVIRRRFLEGRISTDQVDAVVNGWNDRVSATISALDEILADLAESTTTDQFGRDLRSLLEAADTDGAEPDPGHRDRGLSINQGYDGRYLGSFTLSSIDGAKVQAALDALVEQYRRDDKTAGLSRTAAQRRADALVALVSGAVDFDVTVNLVLPADLVPGFSADQLTPPGGSQQSGAVRLAADPTSRPMATGQDTADGHQSRPDGGVAPLPGTAASPGNVVPGGAPPPAGDPREGPLIDDVLAPRWRAAIGLSGPGYSARLLHSSRRLSEAATLAFAVGAAFRPVVVNPHNGSVLYYGRKNRLASIAQRGALAVESSGVCAVAGCDQAACYSDAHHVDEWGNQRAGTDQDNLLALCGDHHKFTHESGWTVLKNYDHPDAAPSGAVVVRPDGTTVDPAPGWTRRYGPGRGTRPRGSRSRVTNPRAA